MSREEVISASETKLEYYSKEELGEAISSSLYTEDFSRLGQIQEEVIKRRQQAETDLEVYRIFEMTNNLMLNDPYVQAARRQEGEKDGN